MTIRTFPDGCIRHVSIDAFYGETGTSYGSAQGIVGCAIGIDCRRFGRQIHGDAGNAGDSREDSFNGSFASATAHAFDMDGFFHGVFPFRVGSDRFCPDRWQIVRQCAGIFRHLRSFGCEESQTQGIQHDGNGGETHGSSRDHGVQGQACNAVKHTCRNRDADNVIDKCPEKVLPNVLHDGFGQVDGGNHVHQVAFHEDDVGRFDGDVRSRWQSRRPHGQGQARR